MATLESGFRSKSLQCRRNLFSHANVRSTIHRFGNTINPSTSTGYASAFSRLNETFFRLNCGNGSVSLFSSQNRASYPYSKSASYLFGSNFGNVCPKMISASRPRLELSIPDSRTLSINIPHTVMGGLRSGTPTNASLSRPTCRFPRNFKTTPFDIYNLIFNLSSLQS